MKILITGATGFLGGALTSKLLGQGASVRILARDERMARMRFGEMVEIVSGEITDPAQVRAAVAGVEVIYHLAGRLYHPSVPAELYYRTHVEGTRVLLEACRGQSALRRVVHCSTTGVYGVTGKTPASEETAFRPTNPYEASKLAGEQLALHMHTEQGLPVCVARPGLVYGPGDLHLLALFSAIKRGLFRVIAGGEALLHPIYIDDLSEALLLCAERAEANGRCYNLAGERAVSICELARGIAQALERKLPDSTIPLWLAYLAADTFKLIPGLRGERAPLTRSRIAFLTHSRVYTISRARAELNFQPAIALDEGLRLTVAWYRKQGYL
jgi:nucleoside-diphosphate-sugar epimerase